MRIAAAALPSVLLVLAVLGKAFSVTVPLKTYTCLDTGECQLNSAKNGTDGLSQSVCLMTCGQGNIWPFPTGKVSIGKLVERVQSNIMLSSSLQSTSSRKLFESMQINFFREIDRFGKKIAENTSESETKTVKVIISVKDETVIRPSPYNDESYSLDIAVRSQAVVVSIVSQTLFGARHALETLSQLISVDDVNQALVIAADVHIQDAPKFSYRGIMIDVSRHFISKHKLEESVRAAGYNKMNVLHLHLSDTASIPITIPSREQVTMFGAYDNDKIFTVNDMQSLVALAASYGVMVLPEIDAPAHMSAGWQWGVDEGLGDLVLCTDPLAHESNLNGWKSDSLEPPSGQLNLANENAFTVLNEIYHDVIEQFQPSMFHIGGDEVIVGSDEAWASCYNSTKRGQPILDYLETRGLSRDDSSSFYSLWENFTVRATNMVQQQFDDHGLQLQKLHIWGGGGVDSSGVCYNLLAQDNLESFLPPSLFNIQVWDESDDSIVPELISKGYDVVLSNTDYVYLDCGNAGFTNPGGYWCQPYHEWFHIYQYISDVTKKWSLTEAQKSKIFGSETLIWTEMVDDNSVSQKLWPRSAALAEALWSDPSTGWFAANKRMQQWRNLLVERGVEAEALQPLWCQQRSGDYCSLLKGTPQ